MLFKGLGGRTDFNVNKLLSHCLVTKYIRREAVWVDELQTEVEIHHRSWQTHFLFRVFPQKTCWGLHMVDMLTGIILAFILFSYQFATLF